MNSPVSEYNSYSNELFMNPVIVTEKTYFSAEKVRIDFWKCGGITETELEGNLEIPVISESLLHVADCIVIEWLSVIPYPLYLKISGKNT